MAATAYQINQIVAVLAATAGNTTPTIAVERLTEIKQLLTSTVARLEALQLPTARPAPVRTFLGRTADRKLARATLLRAGNSLVLTIVVRAGQTVRRQAGVEIVVAIEASRPAQVRGPAGVALSVAGAAAQRVRAVPAAVPVWGPEVAAADVGGDETMRNKN